jgi:hypothetical protein
MMARVGDDMQGMFPIDIAFPPSAVDSRAAAARWRRNDFILHAPPTEPMSKSADRSFIPAVGNEVPPQDLQPIADWFQRQPDARERFRWTLRDSLDELMDGQRTGRWCYQHLTKTEKTYLGTAIEVNLTKEFDITSGSDLDWKVAGQDLDCKFSRNLGGWEIPMEMYLCPDHREQSGKADHPALLTWLNDDYGQWAAGLIRITDAQLRWKKEKNSDAVVRAYNRDNKRKLSENGRNEIFWLWGGLQTDLPTNLLLRLPGEQRQRILTAGSGQQRVNQLFREVTHHIISRPTVLTVGQQDDAPKRARDTRKGQRGISQEGFVVLGHLEGHRAVAQALGLTVPVKGEWISVRLTEVPQSDPRSKVWLSGMWWAIARPDDLPAPAPEIPRSKLPEPPN